MRRRETGAGRGEEKTCLYDGEGRGGACIHKTEKKKDGISPYWWHRVEATDFNGLGEGALAGTGEGHASLNRYFFIFR
jgi:hypothetical protein